MTDRPLLKLHMHPLSSYCWKVLLALYEADTPFEPIRIDGPPASDPQFAARWPMAKMPLLEDGAHIVPETSIIIDYLQAHYPGDAVLIPDQPEAAREVRLWDRVFDLYVHTPLQKHVADRLRPHDQKDPAGVADAAATLETAYALLERRMSERGWAAGESFSMADCAAMPALFYAAAVRPFSADHPALSDYFERLIARASARRVLEDAKPWLQYFPFADGLEPRFRPD